MSGTAGLDLPPFGLAHRIYPGGRAVIAIRGELDAATAEHAYDYARQIIDRTSESVTLDLAGLSFCDARGLRTLVRLAAYTRAARRQISLSSPQPPILKIMRITGVDASFPELRQPGRQPGPAGTAHFRQP